MAAWAKNNVKKKSLKSTSSEMLKFKATMIAIANIFHFATSNKHVIS